MPRKKDSVKGGAPIARIRENSRLMRTHEESMVDFITGRHGSTILDVFASGLLGFDFLSTFDGGMEDDLVYFDDDDDEEDYLFYPPSVHKHLEPHPRIKQLTDEEADRHAKELIEEEERQKEKTERNKRKKLRKKEKKRLEKENAIKNTLPGGEQGKTEETEDKSVIENNMDLNESSVSGSEAAGCDESSSHIKEGSEGNESSHQQGLDLNNSYACTTKAVPEMFDQRPVREKKKKKTKLQEVQTQKNNLEEKPEVQKEEERPEPYKEKPMDSTTEELSKRSREFAGMGNRLAASGQFEMAVKCFTDAIKYDPKELKLFGNRSLCYERLQQYGNALRDADIALSIEPNWIKGLFRKGKALCGLKRYYEASLIYKEVLKLESSSAEAMQELKRAQALHLMEMGFTWAQSSEALRRHGTLEEAVEALFSDAADQGSGDAGASWDDTDQPVVQAEEDNSEGQWIVLQTSRPRTQQVKDSELLTHSRSKSQSPPPHSKNSVKPNYFSVWVGSLTPAVTYSTLHELFSRAGTVCSIKMLLEQQCAFVNYTRKEDCDRAIQCIDGMVVEGAPLAVKYPNRYYASLGLSRSTSSDPLAPAGSHKKECFFWRTTGCTRQDCTFRHAPENKNIDKDKFTSRLGHVHV